MNKCYNCPHGPHKGHCVIRWKGLDGPHVVCSCYTAEATPQVERRQKERGPHNETCLVGDDRGCGAPDCNARELYPEFAEWNK